MSIVLFALCFFFLLPGLHWLYSNEWSRNLNRYYERDWSKKYKKKKWKNPPGLDLTTLNKTIGAAVQIWASWWLFVSLNFFNSKSNPSCLKGQISTLTDDWFKNSSILFRPSDAWSFTSKLIRLRWKANENPSGWQVRPFFRGA